MISNELSSGNNLMDNIQLKLKSLTTLLSEIKQSSPNNEFDPLICDDIYTYIQVIQTDCQKVINNNKYDLFSNNDHIHNIYNNIKIKKPIQIAINNDHYDEKMQKFEDEIDFHVNEIIKSLMTTSNILETYYKEISLLDDQTNVINQKLNSQKNAINNNIDEFNNADVRIGNTFLKWKETIKQLNDENILLTNEAHKLIFKYQENMLMVKNNIMNIIESASKSLLLRTECLKLEFNIIWVGATILKIYKNIDKLIKVNEENLNYYNDLQSQMGNINKEIKRDLDFITCTSSKMKNSLSDQIQNLSNIKKTTEEKFRHLCVLNDKIPIIEEHLLNSYEYVTNIEHKIKEYNEEIIMKRQQIADENEEIKYLENNIANKRKVIIDNQNLIDQKQSQLQNIKSENEKLLKESESKKLELQKKQINLEIMKAIMNHHKEETNEKIQFYRENIIQPLELKLEKNIALVEYEEMRNAKLKYSTVNLSPEFENKIEKFQSHIKKLDKSIKKKHEKLDKYKEKLKNIQLNVLHQLDISSTKNDEFMNIFQTLTDYKIKMADNIEIKQKSLALECELFQKRYEINRKSEKLKEEENLLTEQIKELKQLVRQRATYNKELSMKYIKSKK